MSRKIYLYPTRQIMPCCFFYEATGLSGTVLSYYQRFTTTLRHTTVSRTPLDEWLAQRTDLYLITHNAHNKQTSVPPATFEPAIPASKRLQTHVLDRAVTGNNPLLLGYPHFHCHIPAFGPYLDPFQSNCRLHVLSI